MISFQILKKGIVIKLFNIPITEMCFYKLFVASVTVELRYKFQVPYLFPAHKNCIFLNLFFGQFTLENVF